MGRIAVACYRARPGREDELIDVVREHVPTLQTLGFATGRPAIVMRATDGTVVEIFEWASSDAKKRAHEHEAVLALWERFSACADFPSLADLAEATHRFSNFDSIDL